MSLRNIRILITCSWILLLGVAGIFAYMAIYNKPDTVKEELAICGNSDISIDKFSSGYDKGNQLFQSHCASCHHLLKDATGPALKSAIVNRDTRWLRKFLTNPKFKPNDKQSKEMRKMWNDMECMKFPNLSNADVDSLYLYISNKSNAEPTYVY